MLEKLKKVLPSGDSTRRAECREYSRSTMSWPVAAAQGSTEMEVDDEATVANETITEEVDAAVVVDV